MCVPQVFQDHGYKMVPEYIQASLIYKCKRWGPPAAGLLFFFAEAGPEMTVEVCTFLSVFRRMWHMTTDQGIYKAGPSSAKSH